jgi:hypothetical protein
MDNNSKARIYGELLNEHTRIGNMISEINAQDFELNQDQKQQIRILQNRQIELMKSINKLFSM